MSAPEPSVLTPAQIDRLREQLRDRLDDVRAGLAASTEDARPVELDLAIGRLTRVDALQQQQMAAARRRRLQLEAAQVQQALRRMDAGSYGECLRCEEPIGLARLRVRPETPLCLRCQGGLSRGP